MYGTIHDALASYWRQFESKTTGKMPIGEFLKKQVSQHVASIIFQLWISPTTYTDRADNNPMDCFIDITPPVFDKKNLIDNFPSKCTSSKLRCSIQRYFVEKKNQFIAVEKALQKQDKKTVDQKCKSSLHQHNRKCELGSYDFNNQNAFTAHKCWNCGDAILGVSSPDGCAILTSNTVHFQPIVTALEKTVRP